MKKGHNVSGNKFSITHGKWGSQIYMIWAGMVKRCNNPNDICYEEYGGRGIEVCTRWLEFENFFEDMGEPPEGMSLDRIKNNKGYYLDNCKWSTSKEQARNRRGNRLLTYNGITKLMIEWSEDLNINYSTLKNRLGRGWTVERALSHPTQSCLKSNIT